MFRLVRALETDSEEFDGVSVCEEVLESCVSVRRKEVKSGRIIWKGS